MERTFKTLKEILDFDFSSLEPKSNYISFTPSNGKLPRVRNEFQFKKWRVITRLREATPKIIIEITPKWLTITIHEGNDKETRRGNFERKRKNPKSISPEIISPKIIIEEIFEF